MRAVVSSYYMFTESGCQKQDMYIQVALNDEDTQDKTESEINEIIKKGRKTTDLLAKSQFQVTCKELYKRDLITEKEFKRKLIYYKEKELETGGKK